MSPAQSHVRAWFVVAAVDWPPGSAKRWPGKGAHSVPQGPNRPAELTVVADNPTDARVEAACLLGEAGHKWHAIIQMQRRPNVEEKAAELVAEALERANHDSRVMDRVRKAAEAATKGTIQTPFHTGRDILRDMFGPDNLPDAFFQFNPKKDKEG